MTFPKQLVHLVTFILQVFIKLKKKFQIFVLLSLVQPIWAQSCFINLLIYTKNVAATFSILFFLLDQTNTPSFLNYLVFYTVHPESSACLINKWLVCNIYNLYNGYYYCITRLQQTDLKYYIIILVNDMMFEKNQYYES